jgi:hypothetical protein
MVLHSNPSYFFLAFFSAGLLALRSTDKSIPGGLFVSAAFMTIETGINIASSYQTPEIKQDWNYEYNLMTDMGQLAQSVTGHDYL